MDSPFWIYAIGLAAQVFYTGRVLIQWYRAEKTHTSPSPTLYWLFSIAGSTLLFLYGWLRNDFSILFGEFLAYYIYMWNLKAKGVYARIPRSVPIIQAVIPLLVLAAVLRHPADFRTEFLQNADVPLGLLLFGSAGQFIFKMRFVYQLVHSIRHQQSLMPLMFWIIATLGSLMIIVYGIIRHDWVLVLGQIGIVASIRNIIILLTPRHEKDPA